MAMQLQHYFMTSLPSLPGLGDAPPVSLADFVARTEDLPEVRCVVDAVLLEHDLMLRQAALSGEIEQAEPVVLTSLQARGEEDLPPFLRTDEEIQRTVGDDVTWELYFRHVADVAGATGCEFLSAWAGFETALRNALVFARAKALELTAEEYVVAAELADPHAEVESIVAAWSAAGDPLAAQKALDAGRWDWLNENRRWFSFRIDEAAAYARGLVLLHRWRRLNEES